MSPETGGIFWVRAASLPWMRVLLAVVVALLLVGCGQSEVDCEEPVDFAAWREATTGERALEDGDPEQVRRSVAAHLVECGTIDGRSLGEVRRLLGRGHGRGTSQFYLGSDWLDLDDEVMIVVFDRYRRVKHVLVGQS
jgi:hypothetical protein